MKKSLTSLFITIAMLMNVFCLSSCSFLEEYKDTLERDKKAATECTSTDCNDGTHAHTTDAKAEITPYKKEYNGQDSELLGQNEVVTFEAMMQKVEAIYPAEYAEYEAALKDEAANVALNNFKEEQKNISFTVKLDEVKEAYPAEYDEYEATLLATAYAEVEAACMQKVADAQAEVTKIQSVNDTLIKRLTSYNELKAANKKLQEAYDELVMFKESGWVVKGDKAYCRYEYAVKRTLNQLDDGTWYHQAKEQVKEVVLYDDIIIGGNTMVYLDKTVEMARKDYQIAVSFDAGKHIHSASIANYNWSESAAFQGGALTTGYNLVETDKNGNLGRQDTIAQYIIGYVVNENAELGVDFYIKAGLYESNPTVCTVCYKINCDKSNHCTGCWNLISQCSCVVKVQINYVDRAICSNCGATDCEGHCGICTKTISNCECELETVYVEVPGETVYVEVPGETEYVEVPGETEYVEVPGETVYVEVPGETVYVEVPGETVYVEVPGETVYVEVPGETVYVEVPGETVKVYYCGKCNNLLEECTCKDSDHNELEDVEDPNNKDSNHNELENVENPNNQNSNHNGLENVENPNNQNSNSNHSNFGFDTGFGGNHSSTTEKQSAHSFLGD